MDDCSPRGLSQNSWLSGRHVWGEGPTTFGWLEKKSGELEGEGLRFVPADMFGR